MNWTRARGLSQIEVILRALEFGHLDPETVAALRVNSRWVQSPKVCVQPGGSWLCSPRSSSFFFFFLQRVNSARRGKTHLFIFIFFCFPCEAAPTTSQAFGCRPHHLFQPFFHSTRRPPHTRTRCKRGFCVRGYFSCTATDPAAF